MDESRADLSSRLERGTLSGLSFPNLATERGDVFMIEMFLISVMAGIAAYYICKWLDGNDCDN